MTESINRDKLADKVNKLLTLANSDNEHEAALAAQRAMEILAKYNLTRDELAQREYVREFVPRHYPKQAKWVTPILVTFFQIRVMQDNDARCEGLGGDGGLGSDTTMYAFVGEPHNVEVAQYVYTFLMIAYKNRWKEYCAEQKIIMGRKPGERNADGFYMGIKDGLTKQLSEAQAAVLRTYGNGKDMIPVDSRLMDFYRELYPNAVAIRRRSTYTGAEYGAGHAQGENMRIRKAMRNTGSGKFGGLIA